MKSSQETRWQTIINPFTLQAHFDRAVSIPIQVPLRMQHSLYQEALPRIFSSMNTIQVIVFGRKPIFLFELMRKVRRFGTIQEQYKSIYPARTLKVAHIQAQSILLFENFSIFHLPYATIGAFS